MILDKILQAIAAWTAFLVGLIPSMPGWPGGSIGADIAALISLLAGPMNALDYYIPLHEMLQITGVIFAAETGLAVWSITRFVMMMVRGVH
jgi:hypothetical protein